MIQYELLEKERYGEIAQFLLDNFFLQEPFGLALGLTVDQVQRWFVSFLNKMLDYSEPVSYIAVDSETGKIAGTMVNIIIDPSKPQPPSMKSFLDPVKEPVKFQIATFLEKLEEGLDVTSILNQPANSKIFACLFLSVATEYGGKGIAKELVRKSEAKAKEIPDVPIAMTDVTSAFSYSVFLKLDYKVIKEVDYLTYEDPVGGLIFKDKKEKLGVHTHARVVAKLF